MALPRSSVLVPLYVYPLTLETWSPLYDAIARHPQLPFTIIINPNSGPGEGHDPRPDDRYCHEIAKLNTFPNVTLLGYVRIDYCKRDVNKVLREITYYGRWAGLKADGSDDPNHVPEIVVSSEAFEEGTPPNGHARPPVKQKPSFLKALRDKSPFRSRTKSPSAPAAGAAHLSPGSQGGINTSSSRGRDTHNSQASALSNDTLRKPLSMQGIFFDETPNIHDPKKREFLRTITHAAKHTPGIGGKQLVLHNPGTMPDAQLVDPNLPFDHMNTTPDAVGRVRTQGSARVVPDVTAVFEASHAEYLSPSPWMKEQMSKCKLDRTRQAYFVHSVPVDRVQELSMRLRNVAGHIYISDLTEGFYCAFDESFPKFVDGMAFAG